VEEIAKQKMKDLNTEDLEAAVRIIEAQREAWYSGSGLVLGFRTKVVGEQISSLTTGGECYE